jgi:hypothetical protein
LKPLLERIDGFISVERFQSLANPDKILSLSYRRAKSLICPHVPGQYLDADPHFG